MITIKFKDGGSLTLPADKFHTTGMYVIAFIEGQKHTFNRTKLEALPKELDAGNTYGH